MWHYKVSFFVKVHTLNLAWQICPNLLKMCGNSFDSLYTVSLLQDLSLLQAFLLVFGKIVTKIGEFLLIELVQLCFSLIFDIGERMT